MPALPRPRLSLLFVALIAALPALAHEPAEAPKQTDRNVITVAAPKKAVVVKDATVQKMLEISKTDPRAMHWLDVLTNRFGGRFTGSDAYSNAARWAQWQFSQWGLQSELEEVGQVVTGFNRGAWFGQMTAPKEMTLRFGTPSYTAGTKGKQKGPAIVVQNDDAWLAANADKLRGAWALIPGDSRGFSRDGRKEYKPDPLGEKLQKAGVLGTIQSAKEPLSVMDGAPMSWDKLPELPDIKLTATQYTEIADRLKNGETVELEFDIRNHFAMGPIPYHNVTAFIPGGEKPEEIILIGAHLDSFNAATGAVDDGSGVSPNMEAMRLLALAGAKPKRSILMIAYAAEENGIWGASAWTKKHAEKLPNIKMMFNRDGSPGAINGITVPTSWKAPFERAAHILNGAQTAFPFELKLSDYPRVRSQALAGTDASAYSMHGVPTPRVNNASKHNYGHTWHTLNDTYDAVVPYSEAQQHSALATAVLAWEAANSAEPLSRDGWYVADGLYLELSFASGNVMVKLDSSDTAALARLVGELDTRFKPPAFGPGTPPPTTPPAAVGKLVRERNTYQITLSGEWKQTPALAAVEAPLPTGKLRVYQQDDGVLLISREAKAPKTATRYLGEVMAGLAALNATEKQDELKTIRILRSGEAALKFKGEVSEEKKPEKAEDKKDDKKDETASEKKVAG